MVLEESVLESALESADSSSESANSNAYSHKLVCGKGALAATVVSLFTFHTRDNGDMNQQRSGWPWRTGPMLLQL